MKNRKPEVTEMEFNSEINFRELPESVKKKIIKSKPKSKTWKEFAKELNIPGSYMSYLALKFGCKVKTNISFQDKKEKLRENLRNNRKKKKDLGLVSMSIYVFPEDKEKFRSVVKNNNIAAHDLFSKLIDLGDN